MINVSRSYRSILAMCLGLACFTQLYAQTITEKKSGMVTSEGGLTKDMQQVLKELNKEILEDHAELKILYSQVYELYQHNAPEESYKLLLNQINVVKSEIETLEENWRDMAIVSGNLEPYALWHQPETTLGQLIIDYGSQNYVYVMSPEISNLPLSVNSNIPIPRSSWNEMMEMILTQNGVGFKQLNPYLRQLHLLKQDKSGIRMITNRREDLEVLPGDARICFVLTPEPSEVRRTWSFLDKFVNPNSTSLQMIGRDILIVAQVDEIIDLLKLYDFVTLNKGDKEYAIKTVTRVDAEEMAKILGAIFDQLSEQPRTTEGQSCPTPRGGAGAGKSLIKIAQEERKEQNPCDVNGLRIIPLSHIAQAIFLVGTKEEIKKAVEIIDRVECQVGEAREKVIYWYTTKHSDPEELADILYRIYNLMVTTGTGRECLVPPFPCPPGQCPAPLAPVIPGAQLAPGVPAVEGGGLMPRQPPPAPANQPFLPQSYRPQPFIDSINGAGFVPSKLYQNDFYQQGGYIVNPTPIEPRAIIPPVANQNRDNFIVDLKSNAIVMVVEADLLHKIKDLIKKLDVPKKMVQIEALVVEKKLRHHDSFGLNLLRIGDGALNRNLSSFFWNNILCPTEDNPNPVNNRGVTEFFFSHKGDHGVPAFDISYRFMINQEDVQIIDNPTVVTLNQTPAKIAVVDEISINTGVFLVPNSTAGITQERAFTRAQYGITIIATPTIHYLDESNQYNEEISYVTLDTDITVDTVAGISNQPTVTRRHVQNTVSIPDGQTVVIGGLRRKDTDDTKNSIPFLGEIPGFGKLFSTTTMVDDTLELYIFLTPKIIVDPTEDFDRLRREEMMKRPGDIPEFMCRLARAQECAKQRLFAGTMDLLFGRPPPRCVVEKPWYPYRGKDPEIFEPCESECFNGR